MDDQKLMPVAWMHIEEGELIAFEDDKNIAEQCEYCVPLYTAQAQREWKGLTDEEMRGAAQVMDAEPLAEGWKELIKFASAIEQALKEKNGG